MFLLIRGQSYVQKVTITIKFLQFSFNYEFIFNIAKTYCRELPVQLAIHDQTIY